MWVRAVWVEGDSEEEGTVPDNWIRENLIFWPPVANSFRYLKERREPTEKWMKFPLIKIKLKSKSYDECESYDLTTTAEVSESEDEAKRPHKKKTFKDFVIDHEDVGQGVASEQERDQSRENETRDTNLTLSSNQTRALPLPPKKVIPQKNKDQDEDGPSRSHESHSRSRTRSRSPVCRSPVHIPREPSQQPSTRTSKSSCSDGYRRESPRSPTPPHNLDISSRSSTPLFNESLNSRSLTPLFNESLNSRSSSPLYSVRFINPRSPTPPHEDESSTLRNVSERRNDGRVREFHNNIVQRSVESNQQPSGSRTNTNNVDKSSGKGQKTEKKKVEYNFPMTEAKFQERVLYLLQDLRSEINELKKWKEIDLSEDDAQLVRASNLEEFQRMESSLKNVQTRQQMIKKLSVIGGLNYKDGAKMMMQRIMANDLMATMNIKGNRGKMAFGQTAVCQVVTASLVQHFNITEHESQHAIARVLKYAPDRRGGGGRKNNENENE